MNTPEYQAQYFQSNKDRLMETRRARRAALQGEALEQQRARERMWQARRREKVKALVEFAAKVFGGSNGV
jgi:hypothetical protein